MTVHRQPWLHELSILVSGNATLLASHQGDVEPGTCQGLLVDDRRVLDRLRLAVGGEPASSVAFRETAGRSTHLGAARAMDVGADQSGVAVLRRRRLDGPRLVEEVTLTSRSVAARTAEVAYELSGDGLGLAELKAGLVHPAQVGDAVVAMHADGGAVLADAWHETTIALEAPTRVSTRVAGSVAELSCRVPLPPGGQVRLVLTVSVRRLQGSAFDADAAPAPPAWGEVSVTAEDHRLEPAFRRSIDDVRQLLLGDPLGPNDVFAAAGTPWYLTLFGRDALWTARLLLPFGTELAEGTLRSLARRQGRVTEPATAEAPGKIPHELRRRVHHDPVSGLTLPPVYYGTVDATCLWILLFAEAHDWGLPAATARELLPALVAAVGWVLHDAMPGDDGLLRYLDTTGSGLANQGWKDSEDAVRRRDGSVAEGPIALVEAQAYAVGALRAAARLLRVLDPVPVPDAWSPRDLEAEADALAARVRSHFWVDTDAGRYLALALDGSGRAVDGLGSNMGHVLGTGTLTPDEVAAVAAALTGPELLDDFGLRTLGTRNGGFNPLGYHTGAIWTHDTAITAVGLSREGRPDDAARLARRLLAAADAFGSRWPELYSGEPLDGQPAAFPASCRPQAWSAASAAALVTVALGARPDASTRTLHLHPARPAPFGAMRVEGLRFLGGRVDVEVDASGALTVLRAPEGVTVEVH